MQLRKEVDNMTKELKELKKAKDKLSGLEKQLYVMRTQTSPLSMPSTLRGRVNKDKKDHTTKTWSWPGKQLNK